MDTRVRTALQTMRAPSAPSKQDKLLFVKELEREKKTETQANRLISTAKGLNRVHPRRERKIALQQDVDRLRKKLRHEENVHRALERSFTRPLGALPRLPPYLPSYTLELLAEVAVLEEEVVRLEEQVVNFRQGLYQEAVYISSSSRKNKDCASNSHYDRHPSQNSRSLNQPKHCSLSHNADASINGNTTASMRLSSDADSISPSSKRFSEGKYTLKKPNSCLNLPEEQCGKENRSNANFMRKCKQSPMKKVPRTRLLMSAETQQYVKEERVEVNRRDEEANGPNKLSEDILNCLLSIFSRMRLPKNAGELETSPSVSRSSDSLEDHKSRDPYGICSEFGQRDIGPYKDLHEIDACSIDSNFVTRSPFLTRRLKLLLRKLAMMELSTLTHQQRLAFWINVYNSCMMNAFLEHGIPTNPQVVVAMMAKAIINVGGYSLNAMTIEHFILRLPYHSKHIYSKDSKGGETMTRDEIGLDWPEPLVTFALSCGSWSSPAVRVYKAVQVEKELETAKRDYLQAAVGIGSPDKFAIPKLLVWYLLDFAKDLESLMDWICLQLPSELRTEAVRCLEMGRGVVPKPVHVMPYEFRFRYLLAP